MTRAYELKRRAAHMAETRARIVEAAIELHQTIGPARTSVSAIAEKAGVQRQTYYRHFPDQRSLFQACSGLYVARNPLPDPDAWRAIADPHVRLRQGLRELYAYYAENKDRLKLLGVDAGDGKCIQPSPETVRSNTYKPLSRPLFIYVNVASLQKPEIVEFVRYYLDTVGDLVTSVGYVPLSDDLAAKSKQVFDEALAAAKAN